MRRWAQRAFTVAVVAALVWAVAEQWPAVRPELGRLSVAAVVTAFAVVAVSQIFAMLGWRVILADFGSPLPLTVAARVYFVGQVGKYVPGSVWPVVAQMEMGREHDVPRSRMGLAFVVSVVLSACVGLVVGLPTLFTAGHGSWIGIVVLVVGLPVLFTPRLLNGVLDLCLRLLRRPPLARGLRGSAVVRATGLYLVSWLVMGLHLWLLAVDLGAPPAEALPVSVGAFAVAATLGLLFIIAPAGAGIREVVMIVSLAPVLSTAAATAVAVVSRLVVTLADAATAGVAAVVHRRKTRG